ncbi:MAG: peptidoglycan DD-metalloendopeptidase family protein [Thermodesulfovibrionales bacterium]
MIAVLLVVLLFASPASAAATQDELKKIERQIEEHKKRLSEAQQHESSILGELDSVNQRLNRVVVDLNRYRSSLRSTEAEMAATREEMAKLKARIERQQDWMKRKFRVMYRFGYSGDMVIQLMSAEDSAQIMRTWRYLQSLIRHEHATLSSYRQNLAALDEKQKKLEVLKANLQKTSEKVKSKEAELAEQKKSREALLSSVRAEKSSHQQMIVELKAASKRLQDLLRESAKTDDYAAAGFGQMKGKLPWPAEGRIAVPYGSHKDPQYDMTVFRNGVHIQTEAGEEARAVSAGKVIFAEWFKGFGQLVIVNHGSGYHTLYGNLSEIFSKVGDIIKDRQVLGKVGTSGVLNATGLYFEIRYKGKPLDPSQWLRKSRQ